MMQKLLMFSYGGTRRFQLVFLVELLLHGSSVLVVKSVYLHPKIAVGLRIEINRALACLCEIASEHDLKKFLVIAKIVGVALSAFFGVNGRGYWLGPFALAYCTGTEDAKQYMFVGEVTLDNIKEFGKDFLEGLVPQFYKSDPDLAHSTNTSFDTILESLL
ncbi:hypothetical protein C5167_022452 [Papaver somniferum]|uniref:Uncharacterized protein n=1 Tax=Papaver somniferum TaxID=3469 RepID=A0A4Y7JHV2_PAPSO|nr:hypothetical protein C5167_022452 [Papaver somniferum]